LKRLYAAAVKSNREKDIVKHGYSTKFAYHIVRLLNEVEQILTEQDLDIQRNREQLKSIRRGDWTLEQIENYFEKKELELEPDEEGIKNLLMECLEMHYGSLDACVVQPSKAIAALKHIEEIANITLNKQEIITNSMNIIKR